MGSHIWSSFASFKLGLLFGEFRRARGGSQITGSFSRGGDLILVVGSGFWVLFEVLKVGVVCGEFGRTCGGRWCSSFVSGREQMMIGVGGERRWW